MGVLSRGLHVGTIVEQAGTSEKTFFATFKSKARYLDELVVALNEGPRRLAHDLVPMVESAFVETKGDPRRTVRTVCAWDFQQVIGDPTILLQLAALVLAQGHRPAMRKLREAYASYDDAGIKSYETILAKWGASLRAPFTAESVAVTLTALVEGLAIRRLADPEAVSDDLFGDAVVALVGSIVDTGQNHEHIDDVVAPLADEIMLSFEVRLDGMPDDPRASIIEAADAEFAARGYFSTTLVHISVRAGVPVPVLKQLFPSKASIVVNALLPRFAELRSRIADDIALGLGPVDVVQRYLGRLASFALNKRPYVEAFLMVVAHDTAGSPETAVEVKRELNLPDLLAPVIETGQRQGIFSCDIEPYEAAAAITNSLLLRCFTRRDDDADRQASAVATALLQGLLTRSSR